MPPRLPYTELAPAGFAAMRATDHYLNTATALPAVLLELVRLRASILNGCHFCVGFHSKQLQKHNEPETRIAAVHTWAVSDAFTPTEQAALRWTDALTNVQISHASAAEYTAVSEHFHGKDLVDLSLAIAEINAWNRIGIGFDMRWEPQPHHPPAQPVDHAPQPEQHDAIGDDGDKVAQE